MPVSRGRSPADSNVSENESKSLWTNTEYYRSRTMIVDDAANRSEVWVGHWIVLAYMSSPDFIETDFALILSDFLSHVIECSSGNTIFKF